MPCWLSCSGKGHPKRPSTMSLCLLCTVCKHFTNHWVWSLCNPLPKASICLRMINAHAESPHGICSYWHCSVNSVPCVLLCWSHTLTGKSQASLASLTPLSVGQRSLHTLHFLQTRTSCWLIHWRRLQNALEWPVIGSGERSAPGPWALPPDAPVGSACVSCLAKVLPNPQGHVGADATHLQPVWQSSLSTQKLSLGAPNWNL